MKKVILLTLMILLFSCFIGYAAYATSDDYIAAWDFEEMDGSNIKDLSGNGFHGVIYKASSMKVSENAAKYGEKGLEIPLSTISMDTKMNALGLGTFLKEKNTLTITGWFMYNGTFDKERFLFNIPTSDGVVGFAASILDTKKVKLQVRNGSNSLQGITTSATVDPGVWNHYVFSIKLPESTSGTASMSIYINGKEVSSSNSVNIAGLTAFSVFGYTASDDFRLCGQGSYSFIGNIDDVMVFDRLLTSEEIKKYSSERVASTLASFELGGMDVTSLPDLEVSSMDEEGAVCYSGSFPLIGVRISTPEGSYPRKITLTVNGGEVSNENYDNVELDFDDVIVLEILGDTWEGSTPRYYKVTLKGEGIILKEVGFYKNGQRLSVVEKGTITAKASITSSYDSNSTVTAIIIIRDSDSLIIDDVKVKTYQVSNATGTVHFEESIEVENDSKNLELYLVDGNFMSYSDAVIISGV